MSTINRNDIQNLASGDALDAGIPHHSKTIRSTTASIVGMNCPCGVSCAFKDDKKAYKIWLRLHKKKCRLGITEENPFKEVKNYCMRK